MLRTQKYFELVADKLSNASKKRQSRKRPKRISWKQHYGEANGKVEETKKVMALKQDLMIIKSIFQRMN